MIVGAVAVVAVVGAVALASGLFGSSEATTSITTTTTVATTTTAAATTTTIGPDGLMALADEAWVEERGRFADDIDSTEAALTDGVPIAAVLDPAAATLSVWEFDLDEGWAPAHVLPVEWGGYIGADRLLAQDLTGDGSAEVFMNFFPTNDNVGVVFMLRDTGWVDIVVGQALDVADDGVLRGYEETCRPDCASGPYIPYRFTWNGVAFERQDYDSKGNPVEYFDTTPCPKPYHPQTSSPYRRCDSGDGVKLLQEALIYYGFLWGSEADGYFGPDTDTAWRLYQLWIDEPVTGVADGNGYYGLINSYMYDAFGGWGD